jgi:hypothetical protein
VGELNTPHDVLPEVDMLLPENVADKNAAKTYESFKL